MLDSQIAQKEKDLESVSLQIEQKEHSILATMKELELDRSLLRKEEDQVVAAARTLEHDKKVLDIKENEIVRLLSKLDQKQMRIKQREAALLEHKNAFSIERKELRSHMKDQEKALKAQMRDVGKTETRLVRALNKLTSTQSKLAKVKDYKESIKRLDALHSELESSLVTQADTLSAATHDVSQLHDVETRLQRILSAADAHPLTVNEDVQELINQAAQYAIENKNAKARDVFLSVSKVAAARSYEVLRDYDAMLTSREKQLESQEEMYTLKLTELEKFQEELQLRISAQADVNHVESTLSHLEQKKAAIKKDIKKLESREEKLLGKVELYEAEVEHLKSREEEYAAKERKLETMHSMVMDTQNQVHDTAYQQFVEKELNRYSVGLGVADPHTEILSQIEMARTYIRNGRLSEARSSYGAIGKLYEGVVLDKSEKKRLYYAILELKTDIELASMS